jgi:hypothetical protein
MPPKQRPSGSNSSNSSSNNANRPNGSAPKAPLSKPTEVPSVASSLQPVNTSSQASTSASALGTSSSSTSSGPGNETFKPNRFRARYQAFQGTRLFKGFSFVNKYRRSFAFGAFVVYTSYSYTAGALHARKRDRVHDSTYLYWKIYDGSIVEAKSSTTVLNSLIFSGGAGGSDEPARIMTIFDVVRTLNWAMRDDRIVSLAYFLASASSPAVLI